MDAAVPPPPPDRAAVTEAEAVSALILVRSIACIVTAEAVKTPMLSANADTSPPIRFSAIAAPKPTLVASPPPEPATAAATVTTIASICR